MKIQNVFPTPIGFFQVDNCQDLNKGLSDYILNLKKEDNPQRSMVGGYHTKEDLLSHDNNFIQQFHKIISKQIQDYYSKISDSPMGPNTKMVSWGMIYNKGDYALPHCHASADLSSAYYCKVPQNCDGYFTYTDPRPAAKHDLSYAENSVQTFIAEEGKGIIFPGWLDHYVTPHNIEEKRICITTNVFIDRGTFFK